MDCELNLSQNLVLGDLSSNQVCPAIRDAKNLRQMFQQKKIIILTRIPWTWNRPNIFAFRFKPLLHRYLNLEEVKTYLLGFILEIFIIQTIFTLSFENINTS